MGPHAFYFLLLSSSFALLWGVSKLVVGNSGIYSRLRTLGRSLPGLREADTPGAVVPTEWPASSPGGREVFLLTLRQLHYAWQGSWNRECEWRENACLPRGPSMGPQPLLLSQMPLLPAGTALTQPTRFCRDATHPQPGKLRTHTALTPGPGNKPFPGCEEGALCSYWLTKL